MRRRNLSCGVSHALGCGVTLLLFAASAVAVAARIPHGTLDLVAEDQWIAAGHTLCLGLRLQLDKGWHVYWLNPGDSGEPPRVQWHLPTGLTVGAIEWPTPQRLETSASIVDYGYEDSVMLIVPLHAEAGLAAQDAARLGAEVKLLVCSREMCIPGKAQPWLTLPIKLQPSTPDTRTVALFSAARKSLPRSVPQNWRLSVGDTHDSFVLTANLGHQITHAIFFPLAESQIENAAPQKLQPAAAGFRLTPRKSDQLVHPIARLRGVISFPSDQSYLIDVPVSKPGAARSNQRTETRPAQSTKEGKYL
jgi:DsbC/DsbD-like thiol-disulfide interchange protein